MRTEFGSVVNLRGALLFLLEEKRIHLSDDEQGHLREGLRRARHEEMDPSPFCRMPGKNQL
jgi:hypothetical protein